MDGNKTPHTIWAWLMDGPVAEGAAAPAVPAAALPARRYEIDGKDRILLPLAWLLGVLFAELFFVWFWGWGLLVPVLVATWYGVLFWYQGMEGFATRPSLLLFGSVCLLALSYTIFANPWFRMWNGVALPLLVGLQMFQWTGAGRYEWHLPRMLTQRLGLLFGGLFTHLGAFFQTLTSFKGHAQKRAVYILMGLGVTIPLLFLLIPLLGTADALFLHLTGGIVEWVSRHLLGWAGRLMLGLFFALFLFSLLYSVRRPEAKKEKAVGTARTVDAILPITVLLTMDMLYLVFVGVQFAALFGGETYLAAAGISYAEYARSGFFQLVFVAGLNLTLGLLSVQFCAREGRGWPVVRVLATLLVGASVIMLGSAAYRMTLYVMEYGLSFKRFLTYWGMVMLAVFFAAALMKIWKKGFAFFRVLLVAGLAGWLVLNYCNVDWLVSKYNEGRYGQDTSAFGTYALTYQSADWRAWSLSAQIAALAGEGKLPEELGVDLSPGMVQAEYDTHGGFHGDGRRYLALAVDGAAGEALAGALGVSADWHPLPLPETLKTAAERALPTEEEAHFTGAEHGYYYFTDRHSESTDPKSDVGLLERHSYNFTLAVYDERLGVLYYVALDT